MTQRQSDEWEDSVGNCWKDVPLVRGEKATFRLKSLSGPLVVLINRSITVAEVLLRLKHILLGTWHVLKIGFAERGLWS